LAGGGAVRRRFIQQGDPVFAFGDAVALGAGDLEAAVGLELGGVGLAGDLAVELVEGDAEGPLVVAGQRRAPLGQPTGDADGVRAAAAGGQK